VFPEKATVKAPFLRNKPPEKEEGLCCSMVINCEINNKDVGI